MAFQFTNPASRNQPAAGNGQGFEKAKGFLNIHFPRKNGAQAQIGKIPLRLSSELEKQLLEFIAANQEENLPKVVNRMTFSFHLVQEGEEAALDLS